MTPDRHPETLDRHAAALAKLRAIIRSKEAADREKDRRALPYLRALLHETEG